MPTNKKGHSDAPLRPGARKLHAEIRSYRRPAAGPPPASDHTNPPAAQRRPAAPGQGMRSAPSALMTSGMKTNGRDATISIMSAPTVFLRRARAPGLLRAFLTRWAPSPLAHPLGASHRAAEANKCRADTDYSASGQTEGRVVEKNPQFRLQPCSEQLRLVPAIVTGFAVMRWSRRSDPCRWLLFAKKPLFCPVPSSPPVAPLVARSIDFLPAAVPSWTKFIRRILGAPAKAVPPIQQREQPEPL